jgi:methylmalonyl-CoA mutase C-terminal domain/subunit
VDLIGLSSLVGAHNYLFPQVLELLKNQRAEDIALIGGGIFSEENIRTLKQQGVKEIFNHRSSRDSIADWVRENIRPR